MSPDDDNLILVDAHVHIYGNYNLDKFFSAAFDNFRNILKDYGNLKKNIGVLCLTEGKNEQVFQHLRELTGQKGVIDNSLLVKKTVDQTEEDVSLKITSEQKDIIILIAGSQITTRENIEVLALGSLKIFENGHSIDKLITEIADEGAIPVIPWGFGKWIGRRGKILKDILDGDQLPRCFTGDSGNRAKFWPRPALFRFAEKMKIKNLPGSDPLPFAGECRRPGSFGFALHGSLSIKEPWKDLMTLILDPVTNFEYFGELESPLRFLLNQLKMQLKKRFSI